VRLFSRDENVAGQRTVLYRASNLRAEAEVYAENGS
jgi:hypothetical protein